MSDDESGPYPAWLLCECCEDYLCTIHGGHVFDCECPALEEWIDQGVDPYSEGGNPVSTEGDDVAGV